MLLCTSLLVLAASAASAETWAYDLAGELMSPFCPGRTLASCPSPQAAQLVQWIALQEASGSTREEVIAVLVDQWGEEILGAPPARGITLWAYVFPVLGFVIGGGLAVVVLRRIVSRGAPPASVGASGWDDKRDGGSRSVRGATPGVDDEDLARIVDRELEARV
jgi:cytochrome c-type biogenesis protein CcmH/NrfF